MCIAGIWFAMRVPPSPVKNTPLITPIDQETVSVCEVIDRAASLEGRTVRVRTTVSALFSADLYAGDEGCVTAHPLVDLRFSQLALDRLCSIGDPQSIKACHALTVDLNTERPDFAIEGVFAGTVESYVPSNPTFTHNGNRFVFNVEDVVSINEVAEPATFLPKP